MKKYNALSSILFWAALSSPMFAFITLCSIIDTDVFGLEGAIPYTWIMWLFTPISFLSITFYFVQKSHGLIFNKNIIIGLISLSLLLVYGSFCLLFRNTSYNKNIIDIIENKTSINIPNDVKIVTCNRIDYTLSYAKVLSDDEKKQFELELVCDPVWRKELGSKIASILPTSVSNDIRTFDYVLFYNVTTGEYNSYPPDGKNEIIVIAYDCSLRRLLIISDYIVDLN